MRGCGLWGALPMHALSVVLDTSDSGGSADQAGCDEVGTGVRLVSTLAGDGAPPRVLLSTLPDSTLTATARFRRGDWVAVHLSLTWMSSAQLAALFADGYGGDGALQAAGARMADAGARPSFIDYVNIDGDPICRWRLFKVPCCTTWPLLTPRSRASMSSCRRVRPPPRRRWTDTP